MWALVYYNASPTPEEGSTYIFKVLDILIKRQHMEKKYGVMMFYNVVDYDLKCLCHSLKVEECCVCMPLWCSQSGGQRIA